MTLTGDYTHHDQPSTANTILQTSPGAPFYQLYNTCVSLPSAVLGSIGLGNICGPRGTVSTPLAGANAGGPGSGPRLLYGNAVTQTGNIDTTYANGINFDRMTNWGVAATAEWDLAPATTLKSISAYRGLEWNVGIDLDGSPLNQLEASFKTHQRQFSQEFQLVGKQFNDRLNYVLGLYYFRETGGDDGDVTYPAGLLQINGADGLTTNAYAAYTNLNYAVTDALSFTLGGRMTREEKSIHDTQDDLNAFFYKSSGCYPVTQACRVALGFPDPRDPLNFFPPGTNHQNFNVFTPKAGVEYKFNPDIMAYGSYSKGFKSGGWTTRLTSPAQVAPTFGPENAETFEVGVKSELFDRRLRLNLAGYTTNYQGIQLNATPPGSFSVVLENAGNARINGLEVEATARVLTDVTLAGTVGYIDAHYTKLLPGVAGVTLNSQLPKTPKLKVSFSPEYRHVLGNGGIIRFGADVTYTSEIFNDITDLAALRRIPTTIVNTSVGYTLPSGKIELSVGGTNITNERYLVTGADQSGGAGMIYGTYSRPAEWYASVRFTF